MPYAVVQKGTDIIYGVGDSADAAIQDAAEWTPAEVVIPYHEAKEGDMVIEEISRRVMETVLEDGGYSESVWDIDDEGVDCTGFPILPGVAKTAT